MAKKPVTYEDIKPKDVGDSYLLVGYPAHEMATLAFAYLAPVPGANQNIVKWTLAADDGDQFEFWSQEAMDDIPCDEVRLLRRVRDGIGNYIPVEFKDAALRYARAWEESNE